MPSPYIITDSRVEVIARKYRIPSQILASFKAGDPEKLAVAVKSSEDRQLLDIVKAKGEVFIIGRPIGFRLRKRNDNGGVEVFLRFKSTNARIILDEDVVDRMKPAELYELLTDWIALKGTAKTMERNRSLVEFIDARTYKFLRVQEDRSTAMRLVANLAREGVPFPGLGALLLVMGYALGRLVTADDKRWFPLAVARALPIASPEPIHIVELSAPGTGKTTWAIAYHTALGWEFYNEVPSLATLVGDARTGKSAIAGAQGVWFDEFDKWGTNAQKRGDLAEIIEVLLTGMEQGVWKRGKGGVNAVEVVNPIPVVFTGNTWGPVGSCRGALRGLLEPIAKSASRAFEERVSVCVYARDKTNAFMDYAVATMIGRTTAPRPSVLRGLRSILQEAYAMAPEPEIPGKYSGRMRRHYKRVYRALWALIAWRSPEGEEAAGEKIRVLAEQLVDGLVVGGGGLEG